MHENLKHIFEYEIANHNVPNSIQEMMNYITFNEENFDAFHSICSFLLHNYSLEFLSSMGIKPIELKLNKDQIPSSKMN